MSTQVTSIDRISDSGTSHRGLHAALWVTQVLLAALFAFAGFLKATTPIAQLAAQMPWVKDAPLLVRFIGISELAGALGVLLPALTRIKTFLTPLAAVGLTTIMVLATLFHLSRGEASHAVVTVVIGALAAFVAWGRSRAVPIQPR